ncbi:DUF4097 family beta strand repeat-containing protein [Nakamurella endophytica]|uniref:DUF4097 domain-containing protein n=1 Tax=Nakamurella endophytica TaxID=1748367 RepID=A0A917SSI5_9ACTN|nr:DUF4097 family beta strand repeat-containing protein [Nakamurella endophytica]GGL95295.1 hypothetical protein GCM10011594_13690 [Nakamurella endophytica]
MYTYLTPEPLTVEIRNAAGQVHIDLSDTTTSTVDVTATGGPLGFLDDVVRAFGGNGRGRGWGFAGGAQRPGDPASAGDPADPADRVRVEHTASGEDGGRLIVDTDPANAGWRTAFVVRVTAPAHSSVRVQSHSADVTVTGPADRVEIRTASGDVRLTEARSDLAAHTASGDVHVDRAGGSVDVRSASGTLHVGEVAGDALVRATSGNVHVGPADGDVSVRSVSGDVRITDVGGGRTEVDSVSGDVEIGVRQGTRASLNLSTLSGSTDTEFEVSDTAPDGDAPLLEIRVRTTSGDIRLHRAAHLAASR